jgi:sulfate adenylyltransferase subunit 2
MNRLHALEAESIEILRELGQHGEKTVILYSVGKDSSVLIHLAKKAFWPNPCPIPLMHIDTGFKFPEMYEFRDQRARELGFDLVVEGNQKARETGTNPFKLGTQACCALLKTEALLAAMKKHDFTIAIGGARRDEEKSRAKERVFSVRNALGGWDPKLQRPEFWQTYNTRLRKGESMRVFPLSNWTELDVWKYIQRESIPVVPLYFASKRDFAVQGESLIPIGPGLNTTLKSENVTARFRTLGCWPCTGAVRSAATTIDEIIEELEHTKSSERATRLIDHDEPSSMEKKKQEGYF